MRLASCIAVLVISAMLGMCKAAQAKGEFKNIPRWWLRQAWCVHFHEGSWRDPNPPYYGGLQMDMAFMRHHGGWMLRHYGTADHWPIRAQLIVGYRGWLRQGWGAWPNTSKMCGLR